MLYRELATRQRGQDINLDLRDQIVLLPLEPLMGLLLDDDDHISRLSRRRLITLPSKLNRLPTLHTLIDMNLQKLLLRKHLLSFTIRTSILCIDDLSRPRTLVARTLDLLDHWAHLAQRELDAPTITSPTGPYSTLLASFTLAFRADSITGQRQLRRLAFVQIFEGYVDTMDEIFGFSGSLS